MTAISKALDEIKYSIPSEVLKVAFKDDFANWRQAPSGIDNQIMNKVIRPRVFIDANLQGGTMVILDLSSLPVKYIDNHTFIYEIPQDRINYREIVSVLSLGYLPAAGGFGFGSYNQPFMAPDAMNDFTTAGQRVMDAASAIPVVSTATAELVGFNTVLIRDSQRLTASYTLRCMIGNEQNLTNINPRSWNHFSQLCILAVKSFIYNTMIIKLDQAFLVGGQELGAMKNYIESLVDSEQMYQTYLTDTWSGVAFMNDQPSFERFLRIQISPGL